MGKPVKNPLNNVPAGKNGRQKYPTVPTAPKKGRQLYVKEKNYLANKKKYDTALPGKLSIVRSDGARVERDMYNQLSNAETQFVKQYVKRAPMRAKALTALIIALAIAVSGLMIYIFRDALFGKDGVIGGLFYPDYTFDLSVNDPEMGSATVDTLDPDEGEVINLSAKPNYGYVFCGWYKNGELISTDSELAYIMPAENVNMMAVFAKDKFDVKVLSMNPAFTAGIDAEYDYLTEITVTANDIAGTDFIAWVVDGAEYSTEKTITFTVDKDFTVYAEYYAYGATEIYTWPTAGPAPLGTALGDIELVGGSANVLGSFEWANPDERIYEGGEYIVRFVPLVTGYPENHALIGVEIAENVLTAPTLKVEGGVAKWNDIDGDSGYVLDINGEEIDLSESDLSYKLPVKMDEYFVSVYAKGDGESVADSEWSNIERYVPDKPDIDELDFGKAKSEYDQDGEMVKFGGTIDVNRDNFDEVFGDHVVWEPDGFSFEIELDIGKYLSEKTKREILNLNKFNVNTDVSIVLYAQVKVIDPKVYAEVDLDFPLTMENLAFGVSYTSMVTTILNISINGEFVEPELRRSTLHLMSMELIGLEEPIYKFKEYVFQLKNTPIQVEFALCFDAVGAIAALARIQNVQTTDYYAGIHAIENGEAIFVPYFGRDVQSNITTIELDGGFDVNLNCVRLSATLQLTDGKEAVSLLRLNLDAFNVETDLSGNVNVELDHTDSIIPDATVETDIDGSYYFYGQVTFEYYVYLKIHFKFLPLGDFEVKLLDGSHILAEWEYAKGGLPKTPYMDEAVHSTTPIYATDGEFEYFIDLEGDLIRVNVGSDYLLQPLYADLDSERIVDIDDHYIYVLSGDKLRRVGRDAPTERTILVGIDKVVYTDRSYIYYTTKEDPNKIDKIYRSDVSNDEPLLITLPKEYSAINMRYDYLEEYYIIYAESDKYGACYFTYDGYSLIRHGVNEHKYWSNTVFASGDIAYYSLDKDGNIVECFIRSDEHGITHADGMKSVGISDLGIFTVIERAGDVYGYELGLYPLDKSSGAYLKIAEVCDPDVANRIVCYDGEAYFIDFDG